MRKWIVKTDGIGILALRLFVGFRLIYGILDNLTSWTHMLLFRDFLAANNFPWPLASAITSVYSQLIAGIMMLIGWRIRIAAILMIVNFILAVIVHRNDTIEEMTPALSILFASLVFLFEGAGRYSRDSVTNKTSILNRS